MKSPVLPTTYFINAGKLTYAACACLAIYTVTPSITTFLGLPP
ncbi:hypothetical protein [Spirosoma telluris]